MWYLRSLERAGVIQKFAILEPENGLALSNTRVPVSGTESILFPTDLNEQCSHVVIINKLKIDAESVVLDSTLSLYCVYTH